MIRVVLDLWHRGQEQQVVNSPDNGFLILEVGFEYDLSCFGFVAQRTRTTSGKFSRERFSNSRGRI